LAWSWLRFTEICSALALASASAERCASTCFCSESRRAFAARRRPPGPASRRARRPSATGRGALEHEPRVLEIGDSRGLLRLGGGERRLGLADLVDRLPLLVAQRGLAFLDLRAEALGAVLVIGDVGSKLVGRDHGHELALADDVSLVDEELPDLARDLRADDHVVGRDDAGEGQAGRAAVHVPEGGVAGAAEHQQDEERAYDLHVKQLYKTLV
jgi:hypothetical protein